MSSKPRYILTPLTLIAMTLLISACGKKPETTCAAKETTPSSSVPAQHDPGVQVAIVPDADLLYYMDLAAMRDTPIMQAIKAKRAAAGKTAPANIKEAHWSKIKDLTGMDEEDMVSLLISADLDTFDTSKRFSLEIQKINCACAIELTKPLPYTKLVESMRIISNKSGPSQLEEIELAGRPVVRIPSSSVREPVVYAAVSTTAKTLLIAFTEQAMAGILQRDNEDQAATPDVELSRLGRDIADGTQMRLLLLASDSMRTKIATLLDSMADPNPHQQQSQRGLIAGFFSPLRHTQNIVLWAKASDTIDIRLAIELANVSQAQQCAQLIQAFIVPMIIKSFEQSDPENKMQVDNSLEAVNEDNTLIFTLQVTEQDVQHWQETEN